MKDGLNWLAGTDAKSHRHHRQSTPSSASPYRRLFSSRRKKKRKKRIWYVPPFGLSQLRLTLTITATGRQAPQPARARAAPGQVRGHGTPGHDELGVEDEHPPRHVLEHRRAPSAAVIHCAGPERAGGQSARRHDSGTSSASLELVRPALAAVTDREFLRRKCSSLWGLRRPGKTKRCSCMGARMGHEASQGPGETKEMTDRHIMGNSTRDALSYLGERGGPGRMSDTHLMCRKKTTLIWSIVLDSPLTPSLRRAGASRGRQTIFSRTKCRSLL